jgi:ribosomal protein S27E
LLVLASKKESSFLYFESREELKAIETLLDTSTINLYRYIEIITSQPSNTLNGWINAAKLLENPDYIKSHFSTLRTKIKKSDAEILKATLRDLGITVKTDADVRSFDGSRVRADIVAVLEGKCDLGWSLNEDGSFDLVADLWGVARKHDGDYTELINTINQKFAVNRAVVQAKNRTTPERTNSIRKPKCPRCESTQTIKYGYHNYKQNYKCHNCGTQFTEY